MLDSREHRPSHFLQELIECCIDGARRSQRKKVDEVANQGGESCAMTTCRRRADDDVVLSGIACEQELEDSEQCRVERHAALLSKRFQFGDQLRVELEGVR